MRRDFYVYVLFRHDSGQPFYVGKGAGKRIGAHTRDKRNSHKAAIIEKAKRDGRECPRVKVAVGLSEDDAFAVEIALIAAIGRGERGPLVNMTDGGEGRSGYKCSQETRAAMSAARKGRKMSETHRAAISAANRQRWSDPTARAEASKRFAGRTLSVETRRRMSEARKRKWESEEGRALMLAAHANAHNGAKRSIETRGKIAAKRRERTK